MKLIDPSYKIINQKSGTLEDIYKHIELCGRTCYKSEDKITENSAEKFVQRMINNGHTAMLEHGTVYLYIKHNNYDRYGIDMGDPYDISLDLLFSPYVKRHTNFDTHESWYTTNLRWLVEKYPERTENQAYSFSWKDIIEHYGCEPTEHHPKRRTVKLTTSLHVYKDITRHRTMSFAIESTRYCNYAKGKFGSELTFIKPYWETDDPAFESTLEWIESSYIQLIEHGWQAQQAAEVLPQCVKADVVITGFEEDWNHIFDLRSLGTTGKPHPEVERIITPIMEEFHDKGWTDRTLQKADTKTTV